MQGYCYYAPNWVSTYNFSLKVNFTAAVYDVVGFPAFTIASLQLPSDAGFSAIAGFSQATSAFAVSDVPVSKSLLLLLLLLLFCFRLLASLLLLASFAVASFPSVYDIPALLEPLLLHVLLVLLAPFVLLPSLLFETTQLALMTSCCWHSLLLLLLLFLFPHSFTPMGQFSPVCIYGRDFQNNLQDYRRFFIATFRVATGGNLKAGTIS